MLRFEDRIALLKSQHEQSLARAAHFNMRILSGVYKSRTVRKGGHDGELMTPEELLHDEVMTANQHIQMAQDCLDTMTAMLNRRTEFEAL